MNQQSENRKRRLSLKKASLLSFRFENVLQIDDD